MDEGQVTYSKYPSSRELTAPGSVQCLVFISVLETRLTTI